jgi:hypothetical protein
MLRPRALDAAFDAWLAKTAARLATGPLEPSDPSDALERELAAAARSYRAVQERFRPARLALVGLTSGPAGTQVATLALEGARRGSGRTPVASFRFELTRDGGGGYRTQRLLEATDARAALECDDQAEELKKRANPSASGSCNVLGLVLPGACDKLPGELRDAVLRHRQRCAPELAPTAEERAPAVPEDFLLTLRRGRGERSLDAAPRYVLSLYANGSVVFHGRNFVRTTERSDGRTASALLRRLHGHLQALDWFGRRGGQWSPKQCGLESGAGDVITVQAHGRQRMVLDRQGCRGPFSAAELSALRQLVEQVGGVSGWTAPEQAEDARGVSEWIVSAD